MPRLVTLAFVLAVLTFCALGAVAQPVHAHTDRQLSEGSSSAVLPAQVAGSPVPLTDWLGAGPAAAAAGSSYTIFADGFEGGTSPWQSSNSPTWGRTSYRTATGAWSAFCAGDGVGAPGPYPGSMDAWLVAGPYDLSTVTSGTLSFKVWLSSQLDHDWVSGMVSVDGVAFYGWSGSGSSSGWASRSIDLTSVPGAGNVCGHSQVWVAFVFQSDATVGGEGAYVDDVVLQGDRAPVITSFSPDSGPSFTRVAVHGSGFTGVTDVRFNGVPAQFDNASDTYLNAYVPSGASSGPISVVTPSGTGTSSQSFIFIPPPVIVGWTPKWGPVGSQVTVTGSGFTGATEVAFGGPYPGTAAVFDVVGDNQISATVPAGATTGCIAVTTPGGRAMAVRDFLVSATTPPPQLSNFAPVEAPVGSKVKLTGFCLTGATSVKFSGRAASFRVAGDELILAVVPARTMSGRITVTTPHGTGSIGTFNVMKPRPRIGTPVCPASVRHGAIFTVWGTLKPRFPAGSKTIRVRVFRYTGDYWAKIRTVAAVNSNYSGYSRYTFKLKLPRGKYRFQAYASENLTWGGNGSRDSRITTVK